MRRAALLPGGITAARTGHAFAAVRPIDAHTAGNELLTAGRVLRMLCVGLAVLGAGSFAAARNRHELPGPPGIVAGQTIKHLDYLGSINGESPKSAVIAITSRSSAGRPDTGRFEPRSVTLRCNGQPPNDDHVVSHLPPIPVLFHSDGRHFGGYGFDHTGLGDELTVLIQGRLKHHANDAVGTVVVTSYTAVEGAPYCTTGEGLPWSAKRVAN